MVGIALTTEQHSLDHDRDHCKHCQRAQFDHCPRCEDVVNAVDGRQDGTSLNADFGGREKDRERRGSQVSNTTLGN